MTDEQLDDDVDRDWRMVQAELIRRGYRVEQDVTCIRVIRPDGTVAITARRPPDALSPGTER